uniref:Uncharacterized protein n=1 Tax=Amphimedon queenslandica TaxID=400682 RepID=A0A1X7SJ57_AMPQE
MKQLDDKNMLHLIRLSSSDKSTETTASSIAPTVGPTQQGLTNLTPNVKNHGSSGTSFQERMEHPYNAIFATIDPMIDSCYVHLSIRVYSRLGKYNTSFQRSHPILARFNSLYYQNCLP